MRRGISTVVVAVAAGWSAAGCGTMTADRFSTLEEIQGPWRSEPLAIDAATLAAGQPLCEAAMPKIVGDGIDIAGRLVASDARGGGRLLLVFAGLGEAYSVCDLHLGADGRLSLGENSSSHFRVGLERLLAPNDVTIMGDWTAPGDGVSSVIGRIGEAVTAVRVELRSGISLTASVGAGWFTAWWPTNETTFVVEGFDASGQKVGEAKW